MHIKNTPLKFKKTFSRFALVILFILWNIVHSYLQSVKKIMGVFYFARCCLLYFFFLISLNHMFRKGCGCICRFIIRNFMVRIEDIFLFEFFRSYFMNFIIVEEYCCVGVWDVVVELRYGTFSVLLFKRAVVVNWKVIFPKRRHYLQIFERLAWW